MPLKMLINLPVIKIIVFLMILINIHAYKYSCNDKSVTYIFQRSAYDFSLKILDRISLENENKCHFVFSPISTWIQLMMLADRAQRLTSQEIWKFVRYDLHVCFRRRLRKVLINISKDLKLVPESGLGGVIAFDKKIKYGYRRRIRETRLNSDEFHYRFVPLHFNQHHLSAEIVNNIIATDTNRQTADVINAEDFEANTLLVADAVYFKTSWQFPFDSRYTIEKNFTSDFNNVIGKVNMMNQIGRFNLTKIAEMKVLELPCDENRTLSVLIFSPIGGSVEDIYFLLQRVRLTTIFNKFIREGEKVVNVKLPRFKIETDFDNLPEIITDIGMKRIFKKSFAEFRSFNEDPLRVSLMTQVSSIEVTEGTNSSIKDLEYSGEGILNFTADKPFAFMLVHRNFRTILLSGIYSKPSLY